MLIAILLLCSNLDADIEEYLDTVVVTATRSPAVAFDTPYATDVVSRERAERRSYRTVPQALRDVPGVLVQETGVGQGSPFIRGFTGFRTLFLIDGIRLNNSVFRSGPNQYWATVDALSLDRLEIVKGPSSVLYGSDAIGGTVHGITIDPYANGGRAFYRGATGENSHVGRMELSLMNETVGAVAGFTGKQFGDVRAGAPTGNQPDTGYDEWDGDFKFEFMPSEDTRVVFAYQHVRLNNAPRTHKTVNAVPFHGTSVGSELQRDLDQERELAYLQLHREKMDGFFKAVRASVSWQVQRETRDRIRTGGRRDLQGFTVGTVGLWVVLESGGGFTYGLELYHDNVSSFSSRNPVQGPVADDATYDLLGVFVQNVMDLGDRMELTLGLRLTYAAADANSVSDPIGGGVIAVRDDWTALTGSARVVLHLVPKKWNLFGGISQGFRAPNLSDLTRFDSARTNEFEIPAPGLDPERYLAFELGVKGKTGGFTLQIATFYTMIQDQIVRVPTGATNGDGEFLVSKANVGDGYVYGIEVGGGFRTGSFTLFGSLTWMEGKVDTFPTSAPVVAREYIDRLMPLTVQAGVRWQSGQFWAEVLVTAADKADRLSTRDANDTSRIPPGGTPGYAIVNARAGVVINEKISIMVGVDNVLDKSYRVHGSGSNMPGINFVFSISFRF